MKCLVSLQYEQFIVMLIWFDAFYGDQKVYNEFKSGWRIVCNCLVWFGVVNVA